MEVFWFFLVPSLQSVPMWACVPRNDAVLELVVVAARRARGGVQRGGRQRLPLLAPVQQRGGRALRVPARDRHAVLYLSYGNLAQVTNVPTPAGV